MYAYVVIALLIIAALVGMFLVPQWRMKRSARKVIRIFRENYATSPGGAKTLDELGLRPQSMIDRMLRGRDYKQHALEALMNFGVVEVTEEGKLYLSEEKLSQTKLADYPTYS